MNDSKHFVNTAAEEVMHSMVVAHSTVWNQLYKKKERNYIFG